MKILIVGSRKINDIKIEKYIREDVDLVISGGAAGVDAIAERYADAKGISKLIIRPEYEKYGRAAPLKRNELMVGLADKVLAFWDGRSRGTKYTIEYARRRGKETETIVIDGAGR